MSYTPLVIKDTIPLPLVLTCSMECCMYVCGMKTGGGNGLLYHALLMQYYTLMLSELGVVVGPNHKGQLGHWNCTLWGGPVSEASMREGLCSS